MNTDHVVSGTCDLHCANCGLRHTLGNIPVMYLVDDVRGFLLMHRRCLKPVEPSKQVELFDALAAKDAECAAEKPFCDHKFVDSKNCLKCGISFAELKAESLGESQRLNGIDAMLDEPDPETDPPMPTLDTFAKMYPMPRNVIHLREVLRAVVPEAQQAKLASYVIPMPGADFDAIAHWARVEKARLSAHGRAERGEPSIPGLYIPTARMPACLAEAIGLAKKKRGARPLSSGPKKRRSGSVANSD